MLFHLCVAIGSSVLGSMGIAWRASLSKISYHIKPPQQTQKNDDDDGAKK